MLNLIFADGTKVPYELCTETEERFGGSGRRTLTFEIAAGAVGIQTLSDECTEENCKTITLENDEGYTNVYEGYVLKLATGVKLRYNAETNKNEEYIELKLGKRTYTEIALADESRQTDEIGAQVLYTAMMTDTLLEE